MLPALHVVGVGFMVAALTHVLVVLALVLVDRAAVARDPRLAKRGQFNDRRASAIARLAALMAFGAVLAWYAPAVEELRDRGVAAELVP